MWPQEHTTITIFQKKLFEAVQKNYFHLFNFFLLEIEVHGLKQSANAAICRYITANPAGSTQRPHQQHEKRNCMFSRPTCKDDVAMFDVHMLVHKMTALINKLAD